MSGDDVKNLMKKVEEDVRKVLETRVTDVCGFKVMVDREVPQNQIWFYDGNGTRHVVDNVEGFSWKRRLPLI